jgi:hypothetical protein
MNKSSNTSATQARTCKITITKKKKNPNFKTENKPNRKSDCLLYHLPAKNMYSKLNKTKKHKQPSVEKKPETQKQKTQANHQPHQLHKQTCKTTTTNPKSPTGETIAKQKVEKQKSSKKKKKRTSFGGRARRWWFLGSSVGSGCVLNGGEGERTNQPI